VLVGLCVVGTKLGLLVVGFRLGRNVIGLRVVGVPDVGFAEGNALGFLVGV